MILPKKYLPINWASSMKFHENHFIENERSIYDTIRDAMAIFITNYNYGVLPPFVGENKSLDIHINQHSEQMVQVLLNGLNAITPGGIRICVHSENEEECVTYTHSFANITPLEIGLERIFNIVLHTNTEARIPVGEPDPEEIPPRLPYVGAKYTLAILPADTESKDGATYLTIGRIIQQGDRFLADKKYIPPCTSIVSHHLLLKAYKNFDIIQNTIQIDALKIISKINLSSHSSDLQQMVDTLCRELLTYIANTQFEYQNIIKYQAPILMVKHFSALANRVLIFLNFLNVAKKEELLNYIYQWIDITPGFFIDILTKTSGIIYQHQNINQNMEQIFDLLSILSTVFQRLSTLEYVGQLKENVVITEQVLQSEQKKYTSSSKWIMVD